MERRALLTGLPRASAFWRSLGALILLLANAAAWGQGYVVFGNKNLTLSPPLMAPVFDVDGATGLAGDAYRAQLYAGLTTESLAPVGQAVAFRTGNNAGYIIPQPVSIPGVPEEHRCGCRCVLGKAPRELLSTRRVPPGARSAGQT